MSTAEINAIKVDFIQRFLAINDEKRIYKVIQSLDEQDTLIEDPWQWFGPKTSEEAKESILAAKKSIEEGKGIPHSEVKREMYNMIMGYANN